MDLNRRDVLAAAAAAGAAAFVVPATCEAAEGELPPVKNLQILMKGLFIVDLSKTSPVPFHFVGGPGHAVTLTCDLADLQDYPEGHAVTVDLEGRELATWVLEKHRDPAKKTEKKKELLLSQSGDGDVEFVNSSSPTPNPKDMYWVASVPALTKVSKGDLEDSHKSIVATFTAKNGSLIALPPSKPLGKCTWKFFDGAGDATTTGVTDRVLFETKMPAAGLQLTDGTTTWKFVNDDVRFTLSSLPPATKDPDRLTHFPHLVALFKGNVKAPEKAECPREWPLAPGVKRESGTAYCPPGKRP